MLLSDQVEQLLRRVRVEMSGEVRRDDNDDVSDLMIDDSPVHVPHYLPPLAQALEEALREMRSKVCDSFHAH
jgi:hypothetical protein